MIYISEQLFRHQGNHYGYTNAIEHALNKIDINQSADAIAKQVANIQKTAQKGMMNGTPIRALDLAKNNSILGNQRALEIWNKILAQ